MKNREQNQKNEKEVQKTSETIPHGTRFIIVCGVEEYSGSPHTKRRQTDLRKNLLLP